MDIVGTYLLHLLISAGLTVVVGTGLARSGRAFLLDVFGGNDTLARRAQAKALQQAKHAPATGSGRS